MPESKLLPAPMAVPREIHVCAWVKPSVAKSITMLRPSAAIITIRYSFASVFMAFTPVCAEISLIAKATVLRLASLDVPVKSKAAVVIPLIVIVLPEAAVASMLAP